MNMITVKSLEVACPYTEYILLYIIKVKEGWIALVNLATIQLDFFNLDCKSEQLTMTLRYIVCLGRKLPEKKDEQNA